MVLRTYTHQRSDLHGGYHLQVETPNPFGVHHCGEQWAPASFQIHPHRHAVWEFYYQLTGSTLWDVSGDRIEVGPDAFLGVSPQTEHALVSASDSHRFLFLAMDCTVHRDAFEPLSSRLKGCRHLLIETANRLKGPFQQLLQELSGMEAYHDQGIRIECNRFMLALQRLAIGSVERRSRPLPATVAKCRQLILSDVGAAWRLADLARACGVSPGHLNRLFKQHVCHTVHDYVVEARLAEADRLLRETDLPIGEIAFELGFTSSQHFSTTYHKRRGKPPSSARSTRK